MKKYEIIFWALKLPLDFLIILSSFFIARELRLVNDLIPWIPLETKTINTESLFYFAIFWAFLYIIILSLHKLYFIKITSSKIWETLNIIRYSFYWFVFFSFFIYAWNWIIYKTEIPRLIIGFTFIIWTFFVILERIFLNNLEYFLMEKWFLEKKNLVLITNKKEKKIKEILKDISSAKLYNILAYSNKEKIEKLELKFLSISKLKKLFEQKKIDEILYIDSDFSKKELYEIWEYTRIFWIRYRYITNSFEVSKTNTSLSLINNIPTIEINMTSLNSWAKIFKRIFDFFVWIFAVIILSPIFIIVAILIKLEDPSWPIIYKNRRIWQWGKIFNLYKFRYMKWKYCIKDAYKQDDEKALKYENNLIEKKSKRKGPLYKIENDPRKTKIWNFIEKYSIDEFPQFFNLILWNMSLVWPRPHQPREVEKYDLEQKRLLTIKPWITWMAQVNGRENNDFKKEAKLDIFYIENWSMLLDFKIIFKTFSVFLGRK